MSETHNTDHTDRSTLKFRIIKNEDMDFESGYDKRYRILATPNRLHVDKPKDIHRKNNYYFSNLNYFYINLSRSIFTMKYSNFKCKTFLRTAMEKKSAFSPGKNEKKSSTKFLRKSKQKVNPTIASISPTSLVPNKHQAITQIFTFRHLSTMIPHRPTATTLHSTSNPIHAC